MSLVMQCLVAHVTDNKNKFGAQSADEKSVTDRDSSKAID